MSAWQRGMVVLDPDDRDDARRVLYALIDAASDRDLLYQLERMKFSVVQTALRSLSVPPEPDCRLDLQRPSAELGQLFAQSLRLYERSRGRTR